MDISHTIKLTPYGKRYWGTKKNTMRFVVTGRAVSLFGGYWDGGSRDEYHGRGINGEHLTLAYPTAPPQFGGGPAPDCMPNHLFCVVHGGVFCGKVRGLTVYCTKLEDWFNPKMGAVVTRKVT